MKKTPFILKTLSLALVFSLVSCDEFSLEDLLSEDDAKVSESYVKTEAALINLYSIIDACLRDSVFNATDSAMVDGAKVMRDGSNISIDFGTGVIGSDGSTRKGLIKIVETGNYLANASLDVSLETYSVNDEKVTGSLELDKTGTDFSLVITGFSADQEIEINANKTISWVQGFNTLNNADDDIFEVSGTASGTDLSDNRELTTSITEVMNYDRACEFKIVSGMIEMTLQPGDSITVVTDASIDFLANDGCDNVAKISITQGETNVELTKQFSGF